MTHKNNLAKFKAYLEENKDKIKKYATNVQYAYNVDLQIYHKDENDRIDKLSSKDTSDDGGIWVIGSTSNVTAHLGGWAGSVLVETAATATVSYEKHLKGTEPDASATVWTDGALTFSGRTTQEETFSTA